MSVLATIIERAAQIASAGSSAFLAMSLGTAPDAANRVGLFADLTGAAEQLVVVVGAQTGPAFLRSGSDVIATGMKLQDSTCQIVGSSDTSKSLAFQVDTQGSGFQLTIDVGAQAANRTLSVPVLGGSRTVALIDQAQTFSAAQTISTVNPSISLGVNGSINGGLKLWSATNNAEGNIYADATYGVRIDTNSNTRPIRLDGSQVQITSDIVMSTTRNLRMSTNADYLSLIGGVSLATDPGFQIFGSTYGSGISGRMYLDCSRFVLRGINGATNGVVDIVGTTASTNTNTGALVVPSGGFGCGGAINAGGNIAGQFLRMNGSTGNFPWEFQSSGGGEEFYIYAVTSAAYRLTINSSGAVIIGTDPGGSDRLRVGGSGYFSSALTAGGNVVAGAALVSGGALASGAISADRLVLDTQAGAGHRIMGAGANAGTVGVIGIYAISSDASIYSQAAQFDGNSTAGNTRLLIYDVDNATLERVTVGAADSGGAGFKLLRIPN